MPAPYDQDLRLRIVNAYARGEGSFSDLAKRFEVGRATVARYLRRKREKGHVEPDGHAGGTVAKIGPDDMEALCKLVAGATDKRVEDLARIWSKKKNRLSRSAMQRALKRFGLTVKKKTFVATEQLTPQVQSERERFKEVVRAIPINKLIFLDEAGSNRAMALMRGWSPAGQRTHADRPCNHGKNVTMLGAVRAEGPVALRSYEGAMNTERFEQWLRSTLGPRLQADDVVIMDNLRAHHGVNVRPILEQFGVHVLYLPPYSPDLNPIELVWSIVKRKLRAAAARTVQRLKRVIAGIWSGLRHRILVPLFSKCGYA